MERNGADPILRGIPIVYTNTDEESKKRITHFYYGIHWIIRRIIKHALKSHIIYYKMCTTYKNRVCVYKSVNQQRERERESKRWRSNGILLFYMVRLYDGKGK